MNDLPEFVIAECGHKDQPIVDPEGGFLTPSLCPDCQGSQAIFSFDQLDDQVVRRLTRLGSAIATKAS